MDHVKDFRKYRIVTRIAADLTMHRTDDLIISIKVTQEEKNNTN